MKHSFFTNEDLADLDPLTRLMFQAMWCVADRNGRLEDRPRRIKIECLPFDDHDIECALADLAAGQFIERYEVEGKKIIEVVNFCKHQKPHPKEPAEYPANPHGYREPCNYTAEPKKGSAEPDPRARESVLESKRLESEVVVPLPAARAGELGDLLAALEKSWPAERCRRTHSELRERAIFDAHRAGEIPGDLTEQARLYIDAHRFASGQVSGCPNLHRWIEERRWTDPLPVKASKPTAEDFSEYDAGIIGGAA